jgi:hypothetical protein
MTAADDGPGQIKRIAAEIRSFHKGRGMQAHDLDTRLGPYLLELAGEDPTARRQVLRAQLTSCAIQLASDMSLAVTASLGLQGQTREMPYLRDRVDWLAGEMGRDYRTAQRRIGAAEKLLAEEIARELQRRRSRAAMAPDGWYLGELRTLLRLDTPSPEAYEDRRVVCTRSGLREVKAWLDMPGRPGQPGPDLTADVSYGGRLVRAQQPSGSRFQFSVELPAPLQIGEEHQYGLVTRLREGATMRSHYLVVPECRCDAFDLRIRFHPGHRPGWVRRVDGETVRMFDNGQPTGDLMELDSAAEVHMQFRNLTMYLGYGIQWQP